MLYIGASLSKLRHLDMSESCQMTDRGGIEALAEGCLELEHLSIPGHFELPNRALMDLAMGCEKLLYLDITRCTDVADEGVATVVRCCPQLRVLLLGLCSGLGDNTLRAIGHFAAHLEELDLYCLGDITNEGIAALSTGNCATVLTRLVLSFCGQVTDESLVDIGKCTALKELELEHCTNITDEGLRTLASGCNNLTKVSLDACTKVTDKGVEALEALSSLSHLSIEGCVGLSSGTLQRHSVGNKGCSGAYGSMLGWDGDNAIMNGLDWSLLPM